MISWFRFCFLSMFVATLLIVTNSNIYAQREVPDPSGQNRSDTGDGALTNTKTTGPVTVTTTLTPRGPRIGDEMVFLIEAKAEKDVELLMPEFGEVISGFPISEWLPKQKIEADGSSTQSVQYRFQVAMSGEQSIPPVAVEFVDNRPGKQNAPDDMDAFEIQMDRIDFTVESVVLKDAARELKPPLEKLDLPSASIATSRWPWLIGGLVVTAVLLAVPFWLSSRRRIRKTNAYELARGRLQRILNDRNSSQPALSIEQFFVEISSLIRRYLEDRFELKAPDLTTDEFLQLASTESELSREHQNLLSEFLQQADAVKFAGVRATETDVKRSSDLAVQFLEETRADAPDIDLPEVDTPDGSASVSEAKAEVSNHV